MPLRVAVTEGTRADCKEACALIDGLSAEMLRENVNYEHVKEPVIIPRPQIEDFNSLVVVHDKVEQYG